jgi:mRNA-degrading endonuclease RelE of RelBE toxin-antitoxin system
MDTGQIGMNVERSPPGASAFDVLDRVLDKGIVIDGSQPSSSARAAVDPPRRRANEALRPARPVDAARPPCPTVLRDPLARDYSSREAPRSRAQMNGGKKPGSRSVAYAIHFASAEIRAAAGDPMLRKTIESLADRPHPPSAMRVGGEGRRELWRLRIDDARVLYEIDARGRIVTIVGINYRKEPYSI